ncbi:helix-turn-helix transcriptional regulator [Oscillibacter hominis]|uniref:Helix-turn-helix transcriptional regulator n=2 Tax=Oscillospiraceae TaxID=216572 RepID=A0A7G9B4Z9_9FIRM|nr:MULTISPECIES: helix-turn-helix transcriptional regulator [Oscillospiraceae]MBU5628097.1 helix-turn-helix domain-containing protein [Dysosmobacter acutus]QNL44630.1 helix-turn-helix transcriptional regulator [Oscillibacter hominis]
MQILAQRLKELREGRRLYQKEMAELLGLSLRGYQSYETDQSEPKLKTLIALADYFDVSIDYLVGRTDGKCTGKSKKESNL